MNQSAPAEEQNHPEVTAYNPPPQLDAALAAVPLVGAEKVPAKIGYLTNYSFHIWYQIVIELLKRRGAQYGSEIVILDANLSVANQIEQARELVKEVDALILTPAATEGLEEILKIAAEADVPVVVEANPVEGMATLVAICDYDAGYDMGVWVGENVKTVDGSRLKILDVGLPTLNGIEVARRIRKLSPQSKILFVSQESAAELVQEALRIGALGYIIKTHVGMELLAAVEAVRQGRLFIGSGLPDKTFIDSADALVSKGEEQTHFVQFYADEDFWRDSVREFLCTALSEGKSVIVCATALHATALQQSTEAHHIDVQGLEKVGDT